MKYAQLKNTIEDITTRLHEVGDPLLKDAEAIRDILKGLNHLEQQKQDSLKLLTKQRQALFAKVQKNYVDSEIETADVLTTRGMLKFEGRFKVGDSIRAFDFEPREGRGPCYLEGRVARIRNLDDAGANYKAYVVQVEKDVFDGKEEPGRVGQLVYVPLEIADHDYDGRIVLLTTQEKEIK